MKLRKATIDDAKDLFELRNDQNVYKNCLNPHPTMWEDHIKWLEKKLSDNDCLLLIAEQDGIFVGQIRLDREWVANISLVESFRNKGLSADIIKKAGQKVKGTLSPYIKEDNNISIKAFKKAGFMEYSPLF